MFSKGVRVTKAFAARITGVEQELLGHMRSFCACSAPKSPWTTPKSYQQSL